MSKETKEIFQSVFLFRFTSYSYCQGTRDTYRNDMRLITTMIPCPIWEAIGYLKKWLKQENVEYDEDSIQLLNRQIKNS
jgi:hypothetical protein